MPLDFINTALNATQTSIISIGNHVLTVSNADNTITVTDSSNGNPTVIKTITGLTTGGYASVMVQVGTNVYIGSSVAFITVLDTTTYTITGTIAMPAGMKLGGNYTPSQSGFDINSSMIANGTKIYGIFNDTSIFCLETTTNAVTTIATGNKPCNIVVNGNNLYVLNGLDLTISKYDITSTPTAPTLVGTISTGLTSISYWPQTCNFIVVGNKAYVPGGWSRDVLKVVSMDTASPSIVSIQMPDSSPSRLLLSGTNVFVGSRGENVTMIDTTASPPSISRNFTFASLACDRLLQVGKYIYCTGNSKVTTIDVSTTPPTLDEQAFIPNIVGGQLDIVSVTNGHVYVLPDGKTTLVQVKRNPRHDVSLAKVILSSAQIDSPISLGASFSASKTSYVPTIPFSAIATDPSATLTLTDISTSVVQFSGVGSISGDLIVPLIGGFQTGNPNLRQNRYILAVTAQDGYTTQNYSVIYGGPNAPPGSNTTLYSVMLVDNGVFNYLYSKPYTYTLGAHSSTVEVAITASDSATVSIDVYSGAYYVEGILTLSPNTNVYSIAVTSNNGLFTSYYPLTIINPQPIASNDDDLAIVSVNSNSLTLASSFSYTYGSHVHFASVRIQTKQANATVRVGDLSGTYDITGSLPVPDVSNSFTITVTAQDGTSTTTYPLTIINPLSDNDSLSMVRVNTTTQLSMNNGIYRTRLPANAASVPIFIVAADTHSTLNISGTDLSGAHQISGSLPLSNGSNIFSINVRAQNGTSETYPLYITNPSNDDSILKVYAGSRELTSPYSYIVTPHALTLSLNVITTDVSATIDISNSDLSGVHDVSGSLTLRTGRNSFPITVTAEDGSYEIYPLTIINPSSDKSILSVKTGGTVLTSPYSYTTGAYATTIPIEVTSTNASATIAILNSNLSGTRIVSGSLALVTGSNSFSIRVTAEDGTHETYSLIVMNYSAPCFPTGTRILTPTGYKAVETLAQNELVLTADGRQVPVKVYGKHLPVTTSVTAPYRVPKGTFGLQNDLLLSPDHAFQIRKGLWMLPKRAALLSDRVEQVGVGSPVTYYHLECPQYLRDNLVVDGAVVESYAGKQLSKSPYTYSETLKGYTRSAPIKNLTKA